MNRNQIIFSTILLNLVLQSNCASIREYKEIVQYLNTYEYVTNDEKLKLNEILDKHNQINKDQLFKSALQNLQRNGNIRITGKVDKNTIELMKKLRCGVGDKDLNVKRQKRYTLMSTKWFTNNITWRYMPKKNDQFVQEEHKIREIIRKVLKVWEKDTMVKFSEDTSSLKDPDILISFEKPNHSDVDIYSFGSQTLGHAFQPGKGLGGDAHFNTNIKWDFNASYDKEPGIGMVSFYGAALHELGHSLGLGHTREQDAIMYEYYSDNNDKLAIDDIRAMHHIYGVPKDRKYVPDKKQEDEDMPVWDTKPRLPDRCNTSYDAITMMGDELIVFHKKYMFGPKLDAVEIRTKWKDLPENWSKVDAVYTIDNKMIFFIGRHVYIFKSYSLVQQTTLQNLKFPQSIEKIDAIFKWSKDKQIYVFSGNDYYILNNDMVVIKNGRISRKFHDVYDFDTAFSHDGGLFFFKAENYYEFDDKVMRMKRMRPGLSANYFMNCGVPELKIESRFKEGEIQDYIDLGEEYGPKEPKYNETGEDGPKNDPDIQPPNEKGVANTIDSMVTLISILIIARFAY